MGRQSFIYIRLRVHDGEAREIRIGGRVVPVLEGVLRLP
jgi:predicted PhzF superfamily epimerase YddE/YHI9